MATSSTYTEPMSPKDEGPKDQKLEDDQTSWEVRRWAFNRRHLSHTAWLQYPLAQLRALQTSIRTPNPENPGYIRQKANKKLWVHERIARLLDEGSFEEVGSISGKPADNGNLKEFTPAYVLVALKRYATYTKIGTVLWDGEELTSARFS